MQEIGLYIAVVLRARTQLLTYEHCWGLASGLTGRVLQKCTQQLTRRTSAQLDGKNNQTDPTQISLFERGRRQGIPQTETNCHRYKLDDRTVTRVKSPAQSFLKSSPSSPNKKTCLGCEALHPTPGSFIAWPQSVSSRSPMWEQHKPRMRNRSRVQHVLAACSTCFVGFCFLLFYLRGDMGGTSGKGWKQRRLPGFPYLFLWYKHVYGITFTSISAWVRFVLRDSLVYLENTRILGTGLAPGDSRQS